MPDPGRHTLNVPAFDALDVERFMASLFCLAVTHYQSRALQEKRFYLSGCYCPCSGDGCSDEGRRLVRCCLGVFGMWPSTLFSDVDKFKRRKNHLINIKDSCRLLIYCRLWPK